MPMLQQDSTHTLTQFSPKDAEWFIVNDGVMGGLSKSIIEVNDGTASFSGEVSLKNNGGFASTRMRLNDVPGGYDFINLEVKGDGAKYHLRLRKDGNIDGLAYDYSFQSKEDAWQVIQVALSEVEGTFRGRKYPDHVGVASDEIGQVGILVGDKQEGSFHLEMKRIWLSK